MPQALAIYRGDFLADFASPGSREFEVWAEVERAYFRSRAVRAAEALCRSALDAGRYAAAKCAAVRLREIDPHAELGWRLLLECLTAAGDRLNAIAEAERFEAWLRAEGNEPEPASLAVLKMARQTGVAHAADAPRVSALAPDLVGREKEFAAVIDAWRQASAGSTRVVTLVGGAGVGKTRLLDAIAQRLRSMRKRVVVVRAYPGERDVQSAFAGTLTYEIANLPGASGVPATVARHLVALDPRLGEQFAGVELAAVQTSSMASRATALRELIAAVCDDAPLALLLDDAHWFDEESRQLIGAALARIANARLLVVIASRSSSGVPAVEDRALALQLAPLTVAEVGALVASVGALPTDKDWPAFLLTRVTAASRGIPLLVLGAIEELIAEGVLELTDGCWTSPNEAALRDRLRNINALASRLRALPKPAFALLVACSIGGRPLPRQLVTSIATSVGDANAANDLERAGYLRELTTGVEVTHDAVAETALVLATDADCEDAARRLGVELVSADDLVLVEHGLRHLAATRALDLLVPPLRRLAQQKLKDSGLSTRRFVARCTGLPVDDLLVRAASRRLPLALRYRRWRTALAAGMIGTGVATSAFVAAKDWRENASVAALELTSLVDARTTAVANVALDARTWTVAVPLVASFGKPAIDSLPRPTRGTLFVPGENAWAADLQSSDSGGADVALVTPDGRVRRLTWSHADESPEAWSPDGRHLAIQTSAFGAGNARTLGMLDLPSNVVRSVDAQDLGPETVAWSPDGTRLAFVAGGPGPGPRRMCVIGIDSRDRKCAALPGRHPLLDGWLNETTLLVSVGPPARLFEYDVTSAELIALGIDGVAESDLSPDGEWIAYAKATRDQREFFLAPADRPRDARLVTTNGAMSSTTSAHWSGRFRQREYLDSLFIVAASDSVDVGSAYHLSARGVSNAGHDIPVYEQRWTSSDSSVATVDSAGRLRPNKPGTVVVALSAGGWRATGRRFVVRRDSERILLREDWHDPFAERWVPFGVPLPAIVSDSVLGTAFLNNGDGWYFSGAYLARPVDARGGLAVDAVVRAPITRPSEQYLEVRVMPLHAIRDLRTSWDHRTGYFPYRYTYEGLCDFAYPQGDGAGSERFASPMGRLTLRSGARPAIATGAALRLRLQIFPDGTCGVALQGERPFIRSTPLRGVDSVIVMIQGNSVGTKLLVGPLTITRGVPGGVDWNGRGRVP